MNTQIETLNTQGFAWFRGALSSADLSEIESLCEFGERPGHRPDFSSELKSQFSHGSLVGDISRRLLPGANPVRLVAFNKSEDSNWSVPWHQDRVIAVQERHELPDYQNWTRKDGYWHVEAPEGLLTEMIFARVHFDDSQLTNGAMELAAGTHKLGKVTAARAKSMVEGYPVEVCSAEPGDVLFVKALTLHRSKLAKVMSKRRALRVDFAAFDLPHTLRWAMQS